jgi:hypothetical protein
VGELQLDGFDTNNLKTDFIRETDAWRELEAFVSQTIEPVLAASRALAHAGAFDLKIRQRIEEERERAFADSDIEEELGLGRALAPRLSTVSPTVAVSIGPLHLQHTFTSGAAATGHVEVRTVRREDEADLLVVSTNARHAVSEYFSDKGLLACLNLADAAVTALAERNAVDLKSHILERLLGERAIRRALVASAKALAPPEEEQPPETHGAEVLTVS